MSGTGASGEVPMEGLEQNPGIPDPAAANAQLQQQIEQQRLELERLRKEKEDADLARQLQQAALHPPGPSSGKIEGVTAPGMWDPKEMSWTQYSVTLMMFLLNCVTDRTHWGIRALTFLPQAAQHALLQKQNVRRAQTRTSSSRHAMGTPHQQQRTLGWLEESRSPRAMAAGPRSKRLWRTLASACTVPRTGPLDTAA